MEPNATDINTPTLTCGLGSSVNAKFTKARDARVITDRLLLECLRQRKGEYSPEECASFGSITSFINTTSTKCRGGEAWLDDILASVRESPWVLNTTPIPSVPMFVRDLIATKIKKELIDAGAKLDRIDEYIRERAVDLRALSMELLKTKAQEAAERMSERIKDQLAEADFDKAFSEFRSDLITYPYAVLKGPVIRNKKVLKWVGAGKSPEVKTESKMVVERISPFDFYWASWATCPNEGYMVEIMRMEQSALYDCIGLPNFDEGKIREALRLYEHGHTQDAGLHTQRQALENNVVSVERDDTIDVLDYWGGVRGEQLIEWGVANIDDEDKTYEVNVWVVGNLCIRAVMNPDPLGKRPYYVSSYEKVPGSMVGRSVPMLMRPHQEIINSAYRSLRRNMGLASGPFAEVDQSRLADGQVPEEIMPGMIKLVEPDLTGSGQSVYRFHQINSHASELLGVISNEVRACDDATGIPAYSYGNSAAGGAGKTVGGLAMLMGNASKGIKKVIGHIERDILEPMITSMYNYNMLYDADETIKVDAQVVVRGPTGIIMRETLIQRRMEALQLVTPYAQAGIVNKDGLAVILREVLKGIDLPVDEIVPDPKKQQLLQEQVKQIGATGQPPEFQPQDLQGSTVQPQGQGQLAMQPGRVGEGTTPTAVLDGRSGPTMQALSAMNQM